jgi:hypothetical protein
VLSPTYSLSVKNVPVIVGVRHNLPFEGDSLLLGNDLAGKKVAAEPIATNEPAETSEEDADIYQYQVCVVTRAMEKKKNPDIMRR